MTLRPAGRRPVSQRPAGGRVPGGRVPGGRHIRRSRSIRRASAGLGPARAGAALALLVSSAALYGVANSKAFTFTNLSVDGAALTPEAAISAALDDTRGANLFQLRTGPLEDRLRTGLTTVADATVSVRLPDTLVVHVKERVPILLWRVGTKRFLADSAGALFAELGDVGPNTAQGLPVIDDRRTTSTGLAVGQSLDPVDLDAATRLGSLVPADVGSEATGLAVVITDASGFTIRANPIGWEAVFGFYTPSLRTPALIPGQVRLLRSLVIGREPVIDRVILASDTDGTYVPKATPTPTPSTKP